MNTRKGYATKQTAIAKMHALLDATNATAFVTRNDADRWIIVLIYREDAHQVAMYAVHKNSNVLVIGA